VLLGEQDIGRLPERTRARVRHARMGFVTQRAASVLAEELVAWQAVALPLALRGIAGPERRRRAYELLELTGLSDRAGARASELSGGERQRLAVCAAVAHRPDVLFADEPTAELDATSAHAVLETIGELVRHHGLTAIVVSHDQATAQAAARTVQIRDGRIAEEGRTGERALVVGRGGWVQLPETLLAEANIGGRVSAVVADGQVILSAAGVREVGRRPAPPPAPAFPAPGHADRWKSADVALRGVTRTLGRGRDRRAVLHDLDFAFAPGRLTVITGPSGSGKSTLVRLLAGLDQPDGGKVVIDGVDLGTLGAEQLAALRRERIGYLAQDPAPVGFLSASENLVLALRLRGRPCAAPERARAALHAVGLADRARQRVSRLSAGEAQRVALARALAGARGLLVVDEPTSRLDRTAARAVAELLGAAAGVEGHTVVCATHDPELIERADARLEL
jgi:ABC-type lipoprotein export system ATPase subunit